ncbi:peptidase M15 [Cellulomonas sp. APG4]|uniref:M15 family metallopeptidase n=1 Tax=Cellulomonas sp. APG4 TaxID=1538656 RepID=UPI00137AE774|nr:M15 family metallopeptidase [Cellulomonas sp. APG4]NCT91067.1 peptidase M15 [Cellulomonas sp. APG4]
MDAVASIAGRIADIQGRIAALSPQQPARVATLSPTVTTSGLTELRAASGSGAAFSSVLEGVVASQRSAAGTAAVGSGKALVDAKGVPHELRVHGNGKVPREALSGIDGTGHRLWAPAARSAEAMIAAARRDGVTIGITDSYRTYETQVDLVRRKGLYSQGGLAATPGTSMHGWGMALDLKLDSTAQAWMRENGGRFGFVEDTPREPWHWGYHPTS